MKRIERSITVKKTLITVFAITLFFSLFMVFNNPTVKGHATADTTTFYYSDFAGEYSTDFPSSATSGLWSSLLYPEGGDGVVNTALATVGKSVEYTFNMSVTNSGDVTSFKNMAFRAFVPSDVAVSGAAQRGYGVRLALIANATSINYQFYPNYAASQSAVGTTEFTPGGTSGWSGSGSSGLREKAYQLITDSTLLAKLRGNGQPITITLGMKTHAINDGVTTVEYYVNFDGVYNSSIYTVIGQETTYYKNGTEFSTKTAYNTVGGGALTLYAGDAGRTYALELSDTRKTTLVPDNDGSKGTMLINGSSGTVEAEDSANAVITPSEGYDLAGVMVGERFIKAPAPVAGVYTVDVISGAAIGVNYTVKPYYTSKADILDYENKDSVSNAGMYITINNDDENDNEAAHNTEFVSKVVFTDDPEQSLPVKMVQIGAFLQENYQIGSGYRSYGKTSNESWRTSPYSAEYGCMVKISSNVIYLEPTYGMIAATNDYNAQTGLGGNVGATTGAAYGQGRYLLSDHGMSNFVVGDSINLGIGEVQLDADNVIYYLRLNGEVILSVSVDLTQGYNIESSAGTRTASKNHVGSRIAFTKGDSEAVDFTTTKTKVYASAYSMDSNIGSTLPADSYIALTENYLFTDGVNKVDYLVSGKSYTLCAAITQVTPALQKNISMYYEAKVSDSYGNPSMNFVSDGTDITVDGEEQSSANGYTVYKFKYEVLPQDMDKNISATLLAENSDELCRVSSYSMQRYCVNTLAKIDAGTITDVDNKLATLLVDMLYYGDEAQIYFDGAEEGTCTSVLNETQKALHVVDVSGATSVISGKNIEGFAWKQATLLLKESPIVKIYFTTSLDNISVKVTFNGVTTTFTQSDFGTSGSMKYIEFSDITPTDFDDTVVVKLYQNDIESQAFVNYSVATYVYNKADDADVSDIVKALYVYGSSAKTYFGK